MTTGRFNGVMAQLRRIVQTSQTAQLTDGQLLEAFVVRREEAAFTDLIQRHGPMVLSVCQRVLRDPFAAEDAFQATFLVFSRKARSIANRELVGHWLYRVAYHTA